ncbi:MAG: CpXC domain-containing protein [Candidatus Micrarchaeia archaeon]
MTKSRTFSLRCKCGTTLEAEFYESIDLSTHPYMEEDVLMGNINSFKCPKCNRVIVCKPPEVKNQRTGEKETRYYVVVGDELITKS